MLRWAPIAVTCALGLGLLTRYESDKNRAPTFRPPTRPATSPRRASETPEPDRGPAYLRIQALKSCSDLRAAFDEAAAGVGRLPESDRSPEAQAQLASMRWVDERLERLHCDG
jgi:hypothetical protein